MPFENEKMSLLGIESLSSALSEALHDPGTCRLEQSAWVSGVLRVPTSPDESNRSLPVPVIVELTDIWPRSIPKLSLSEHPYWLRTGADWHIFDSGWVCFEHPEQWRDHMTTLINSDQENIQNLAAQWITRATAHILHVHYVCHQTGRTSWPQTIPAWKHGEEGTQEYRMEKAAAKAIHSNRRSA